MRIPRSVQLNAESASLHLMWRCHNKEYYLRPPAMKSLYMQTLSEGLKKHNLVKIHSYCVMDNHYHQSTSYETSSEFLSQYMRYAHGLFGSRYNKIHKRSGKVAESRPKTSLIENTEHDIRVHFYIEANPIRAKLCKLENLKNYRFNSFKFYAYGIKDEYTKMLTIPNWYLELGANPKERQRKYRKLFYQYIKDQEHSYWSQKILGDFFIGSPIWKLKNERRVLDLLNAQKKNTS